MIKMYRIFFFLLIFVSAIVPMKAQDGSSKDADKMLLGALTFENIVNLPGWFGEEFLNYTPSNYYMDELVKHVDGVQIICVIGSWCEDSRREIPRLIRILQSRNIDPGIVRYFGIDRNKKDPQGETSQYNIEKVPTIIVMKNGKEAGRIVEKPDGLLERVILDFVNPRPPDPASEELELHTPPQPPPPPPDMPPPPNQGLTPDGQAQPQAVPPSEHKK